MNKTQAEAMVRAVLEPGFRAHEEARRKRLDEAQAEARRRRVAGFALVGFGIGAALGYFTDEPMPLGAGLIGSVAGSVLGWLVVWRPSGN
ncbi:DUF1754 domain-containing protein [Thauera linaloolentis]|uniref:Transmembrane protein n=1 Tax=Thauera linaloolentis (strain DSM 12138 / JCM 21573 / CCUG 41526 / CIP 105981 / IAM 15112 / NBRC 102519 / 47Lol) TaxID=1123367 RepID=N6Z0U6_THAL4|nr:DUF1754 domain-containing protein [Thauera linaloolentis]ENO88237.1 hypothetical protein C666_09255 [Thauera linaloolentis 47Lol = DSM 12138]